MAACLLGTMPNVVPADLVNVGVAVVTAVTSVPELQAPAVAFGGVAALAAPYTVVAITAVVGAGAMIALVFLMVAGVMVAQVGSLGAAVPAGVQQKASQYLRVVDSTVQIWL